MDLILNVIFAWISVALLFVLMVIWLLRLGIKNGWIPPRSFFGRMNRTLRKLHNWLGVVFIATALVHGIYSSAKLFSFNYGTICIVAGILLGVMFLFKSRMRRKVWLNIHRVLSVAAVALLVIHLFDVGGAPATTVLINNIKTKGITEVVQTADVSSSSLSDLVEEETALIDWANETAASDAKYADGVYTGTADGFGSDLTVEVEITDGLIDSINIISHNEVGEQFYGPAMNQIPDAIIESQSVLVDCVSGATYTSIGIKNAVADALNQASISGEIVETETLPEGGHHGHGRGQQE